MKMFKSNPVKDYKLTIEDSDDEWKILPQLQPLNFVDEKECKRKRRIHDLEKKYNLGTRSTLYEI